MGASGAPAPAGKELAGTNRPSGPGGIPGRYAGEDSETKMSKAPAWGGGLAAVKEAHWRGSRALSGAVLEAGESAVRRRLTP